jgi:hypothetical protein
MIHSLCAPWSSTHQGMLFYMLFVCIRPYDVAKSFPSIVAEFYCLEPSAATACCTVWTYGLVGGDTWLVCRAVLCCAAAS